MTSYAGVTGGGVNEPPNDTYSPIKVGALARPNTFDIKGRSVVGREIIPILKDLSIPMSAVRCIQTLAKGHLVLTLVSDKNADKIRNISVHNQSLTVTPSEDFVLKKYVKHKMITIFNLPVQMSDSRKEIQLLWKSQFYSKGYYETPLTECRERDKANSLIQRL
jgi:hypothetical protein